MEPYVRTGFVSRTRDTGTYINQANDATSNALCYQMITDPLTITNPGSYCSADVNESTITLEGQGSSLCIRRNDGAIIVRGDNHLLVLHENKGTIDIYGQNTIIRVMNTRALNVIRARGTSNVNNTVNGRQILGAIAQPMTDVSPPYRDLRRENYGEMDALMRLYHENSPPIGPPQPRVIGVNAAHNGQTNLMAPNNILTYQSSNSPQIGAYDFTLRRNNLDSVSQFQQPQPIVLHSRQNIQPPIPFRVNQPSQPSQPLTIRPQEINHTPLLLPPTVHEESLIIDDDSSEMPNFDSERIVFPEEPNSPPQPTNTRDHRAPMLERVFTGLWREIAMVVNDASSELHNALQNRPVSNQQLPTPVLGNGNQRAIVVQVAPGSKSIMDTCSICQEELDRSEEGVAYLDCLDFFHVDCIMHWIGRNRLDCPKCRHPTVTIFKVNRSAITQQ